MYNKILLPTDGSKNSERAIEHALKIAEHDGAEILVLNVVDSKRLTSLPENALTEESLSAFEDHSKIVTQKVIDIINSIDPDNGVKISTLSVEGNPADAILKVADKEDADLIVIASSGKNMVDRFLLGSVTAKTVRHSQIPVLVVPTV